MLICSSENLGADTGKKRKKTSVWNYGRRRGQQDKTETKRVIKKSGGLTDKAPGHNKTRKGEGMGR